VAVLSYKVTNTNHQNNIVDVAYFGSATEFSRAFQIVIHNQGSTTAYYKLVSGSPDWTVSYPDNGQLGSVDAGSSTTKYFKLTRSSGVPSAPSSETVTLTLEAYSDSSYTNKVGETSFDLPFYYVNSSTETDVTKWDFDDGTAQGWSLTNLTVDNTYSIAGGGYSLKATSGTTATMTKTGVSVPNTNKVFLVFHYIFPDDYGDTEWTIKINDVTRYDIATIPQSVVNSLGYWDAWCQVGVDLTDFAGQTISIEISGFSNQVRYIDDVVLIGTNSL